MPILDAPGLASYLEARGLITEPARAEITPLAGGVSSAIHVVRSPEGSLVVKQALEKLRVRDEWRCDPARNLFEQEFMALAQDLLPGSVPRLRHCDRELGLFVMEYLDGGWSTWKSRLWAGEFSEGIAAQTGRLLGSLHRETWRREDVARRFDNTALFRELRIAPYLLTTSERHPELAPLFEAEAQRLAETRLALVHGDYSPKNLMTDGADVKILDAEVAWFGDPAFDIAFLTSHLLMKAVRFPARSQGYEDLRRAFLKAYRDALSGRWSEELELRSARLVLLLMMARISGKSPVEYFAADGSEARFILGFASAQLAVGTCGFSELAARFQQALSYENHPR